MKEILIRILFAVSIVPRNHGLQDLAWLQGLDSKAAAQGLTLVKLALLEGGRERRELTEMNGLLSPALQIHHLNITIPLSLFGSLKGKIKQFLQKEHTSKKSVYK